MTKAGAGLSTLPETRSAAMEAAFAARVGLNGEPVTLAVLFASPHHASSAETLLEAVHEAVSPAHLIGCVAEAVVAGEREVEGEPAVSVWLASLPHEVETFHMEFVRTDSGGVFTGWRFDAEPPSGEASPAARPLHLMIGDPFTFPADLLLEHLNEAAPGLLLIGGMASGAGAGPPGRTILFHDRAVHREGAVGVRLPSGVGVRTIVSQGCRPVGDAFVVTRAEENVLFELGGRPPLERLRDVMADLSPPDRELVANGLQLGRVIDEYKTDHGTGDFLIRGVLGADPQTGAIGIGDRLDVGQTVRFHVRDAATADEELRSLLEQEAASFGGIPSAALLFTCNGRGSRMFSTPDHDARLISRYLGGAPLAGFFCAGELGPVGGKNFLHGFTASLVILVE